jgi:hypothetical protein
MSAFFKNWLVKGLGGRCFIYLSEAPPPRYYTLYEYMYLCIFSHRERGGEVGEPVRRLEGR